MDDLVIQRKERSKRTKEAQRALIYFPSHKLHDTTLCHSSVALHARETSMDQAIKTGLIDFAAVKRDK